MCKLIGLSIFLSIYGIQAIYLEAESNFQKPKLERNNIVNKGLWIRKNNDKKNGDFIFKSNAYDIESIHASNDAFSDDETQNFPIFNTYIDRSKREISGKQELQVRKTLEGCTNKNDCKTKDQRMLNSKTKFLSTLKPASVFNDYPYEVSVLLDSNKPNIILSNLQKNTYHFKTPQDTDLVTLDVHKFNKDGHVSSVKHSKERLNKSDVNNTDHESTKRSMSQHAYESQLLNNINLAASLGRFNKTNYKMDMSILNKDDSTWKQNIPAKDNNKYEVLPKVNLSPKQQSVPERSLIKILSMLTKTFKKIIIQHNDIKDIHGKLRNLNNDFENKFDVFTKSINNFNNKYANISEINDKIIEMEKKLKEKDLYFQSKESELSKNLFEFELQQKKFLAQQKQFFNVQKFMLAQNEKLTAKQTDISKLQNRISQRQHYFARLLKKAKLMYSEQPQKTFKLNKSLLKFQVNKNNQQQQEENSTTTPTVLPETTDTVKIDLFSIQPLKKIENNDNNMLHEKDYKPVDDLVYKYYFNNTFINDIIRNKILNSFVLAHDTTNHVIKNKRNEGISTTILFPVKSMISSQKPREKRWIKHFKKQHKSDKSSKLDQNIENKKEKSDPFSKMASNFCKELGQDTNSQMFKWCIEKALRKLKVIDLGIPIPFVTPKETPSSPTSTAATKATTAVEYTTEVSAKETVNTMFFPDNDELETNLKQYETKPDTEGTVYYDGSLHASDIVPNADEIDSEGFSDIMPGLDSDSKVQVEPMALELQAERRANVRRINQLLRQKMG